MENNRRRRDPNTCATRGLANKVKGGQTKDVGERR